MAAPPWRLAPQSARAGSHQARGDGSVTTSSAFAPAGPLESHSDRYLRRPIADCVAFYGARSGEPPGLLPARGSAETVPTVILNGDTMISNALVAGG